MAPLRFHLTNQPRQGDAHVYGGRSRFLTDKVLNKLEAATFQGSNLGGAAQLQDAEQSSVDVSARLKEMW